MSDKPSFAERIRGSRANTEARQTETMKQTVQDATAYSSYGDLAADVAAAEFRYGNDGQLNVSTPKGDNETNKEHRERSSAFITALAEIGGVKKGDVRASGTRGVIFNPGKNLRIIMDGLGLKREDIVADQVKGDGRDMLIDSTLRSGDRAALSLAMVLEKETGRENTNVPGDHSRKIITDTLAPKPDGHGRSIG